jgi:hypothetical protein
VGVARARVDAEAVAEGAPRGARAHAADAELTADAGVAAAPAVRRVGRELDAERRAAVGSRAARPRVGAGVDVERGNVGDERVDDERVERLGDIGRRFSGEIRGGIDDRDVGGNVRGRIAGGVNRRVRGAEVVGAVRVHRRGRLRRSPLTAARRDERDERGERETPVNAWRSRVTRHAMRVLRAATPLRRDHAGFLARFVRSGVRVAGEKNRCGGGAR